MATTFHLRVWTRFLVPVEEVWARKTDPTALAAEFRPYASFCFADETAVRRAFAGDVPATLDATLRLGRALPFKWPIQVESVVPRSSIREVSSGRLFSRWEHDRLFEPTPDGCRYVDAITFTSTSPAQKITAILTKRLFEHRHKVAAATLASDPEATGVAVLRVLVEAEDAERSAG